MSEHTPGPWTLGAPLNDGDNGYVWGGGHVRAIAQALPPHEDRHISEDEWRANARLIAAAPQMRDALEWIKRYTTEDDIRDCATAALDGGASVLPENQESW